jgi:hypothetical protein
MLLTEAKPDAHKPCRLGRISDLPISRSLAWRLIRAGLVTSYAPTLPGKTRGARLIDLDSFEAWVKGGSPSPEQELPNFTAWVKGEKALP